MLCPQCWKEEARIHFTSFGPEGVRKRSYCLACAQHQPLSWLLAWGYAHAPVVGGQLPEPEVLTMGRESGGRAPLTLIATGIRECACGCRIAIGAELPGCCGTYSLAPETDVVEHLCHCGREIAVCVPKVVCLQGASAQGRSVVAAAETCLWRERRRRIVGVEADLRHGRATWGTFAIQN